MKNCPLCNGLLVKKSIPTEYTYKGSSFSIEQPQDYCEACQEGFLSHADIKATKAELADFKRRQDGLLTTKEIRSIRKKLHLTQEEASELFGGGVRAFYRYESGEITQSKSTDLILKLLAKNAVDVGTLLEVSNQYSDMASSKNGRTAAS
jgi:HTH-type transcriptional regulator/antitoxin MqsA